MIDKIKLNKNIQILVRIQALNRVSLFFFWKTNRWRCQLAERKLSQTKSFRLGSINEFDWMNTFSVKSQLLKWNFIKRKLRDVINSH